MWNESSPSSVAFSTSHFCNSSWLHVDIARKKCICSCLLSISADPHAAQDYNFFLVVLVKIYPFWLFIVKSPHLDRNYGILVYERSCQYFYEFCIRLGHIHLILVKLCCTCNLTTFDTHIERIWSQNKIMTFILTISVLK